MSGPLTKTCAQTLFLLLSILTVFICLPEVKKESPVYEETEQKTQLSSRSSPFHLLDKEDKRDGGGSTDDENRRWHAWYDAPHSWNNDWWEYDWAGKKRPGKRQCKGMAIKKCK